MAKPLLVYSWMPNAKQAEAERVSSLVVRAGQIFCAIPIADVVETMRATAVAALPGTPSYIAGVSIVRGEPVPVVDLAALLAPGEKACARPCFVLVRIATRTAVVCADAVSGVRRLESATLSELPPILRCADSQMVAALGRLDQALLVMLDACRIVPREVFAQMDASR